MAFFDFIKKSDKDATAVSSTGGTVPSAVPMNSNSIAPASPTATKHDNNH